MCLRLNNKPPAHSSAPSALRARLCANHVTQTTSHFASPVLFTSPLHPQPEPAPGVPGATGTNSGKLTVLLSCYDAELNTRLS